MWPTKESLIVVQVERSSRAREMYNIYIVRKAYEPALLASYGLIHLYTYIYIYTSNDRCIYIYIYIQLSLSTLIRRFRIPLESEEVVPTRISTIRRYIFVNDSWIIKTSSICFNCPTNEGKKNGGNIGNTFSNPIGSRYQ